jgi:RNA methyltransferase, TrmH family
LKSEVLFGLRAGLAICEKRPEDIIRLGWSGEVEHEVKDAIRALAKRKVDVRAMATKELDRVAGNTHHEGLVLEVKPRRWASGAELADLLVKKKGTALALDRVRNPFNIGAIVRSAAFFGVDAILLGAPAPHPGLDPAAVRVAEGGAEHLVVSRTTDLADTLGRLRSKGIRVIGADGAADDDALTTEFGRPSILVLGNEREKASARASARTAMRSSPSAGRARSSHSTSASRRASSSRSSHADCTAGASCAARSSLSPCSR